MPTDLEKIPTEGKSNRPASGAYGEKADLDRLKRALPSAEGAPQQPPAEPTASPLAEQPVRPPATSGAAPPAPGVPQPLLEPARMPGDPSAPLSGVPVQAPAQSAAQRRLAILDRLAESPEVSEETRQWARAVRRVLIGS